MTTPLPNTPVSPLRQKLIDDMKMRHFSAAIQRNYIRDVGRFASFLRRPPDTATTEDVRQFQLAQSEAGVPVPTMNSVVSALRFFFTNTLDRPDLARKLVRVSRPRNLPVVLSRDEVARLLNATTSLKHRAALSVEGHFFLAEDASGAILASGGWSRAKPGYAAGISEDEQAASIPTVRSVFVDPAIARRGVGSAIMRHVEEDAALHCVRLLGLTATLSGAPL